MRAASLLATLLTACGAQIARPEWREPAAAPPAAAEPAAPSDYTPSGAPAARYNDPGPPHAATGLAREVEEAIIRTAERGGRPAPVIDGRLSAVAADLARIPGESGGPPSDAVQFTLAHYGIVEPSPYLLLYAVKDGDAGGLAVRIENDLPEVLATAPFARMGVGQAPAGPGVVTMVIALQEGAVVIDPITREVPSGGHVRVRGQVLAPYRAPEVYVTNPGGDVLDVPVVRDGAAGFRADVSCAAGDGKIKVEVMAEDRADNPTVLANFPLWCGEPAPRSIPLSRRAPVPRDAAAVEQAIFTMANHERARAGVPLLVWDEKAAAVGRLHSAEMRDRNYVAHVSPVTGTPMDRAHAGGLATPLLLENLARAQSAEEAHLGIMDSPGHRANLLNPQATHLGIGVALSPPEAGDHDIYVTEVFFRVPRKRDPEALRLDVGQAVIAARAKIDLRPIPWDDDLGRIAQTFSAGLAAGKDREHLSSAADFGLDKIAGRYQQVVTVIAVVGDPADAIRDAALDGRARGIGIGVTQGHHADLGEGALYVVMMFGRQR